MGVEDLFQMSGEILPDSPVQHVEATERFVNEEENLKINSDTRSKPAETPELWSNAVGYFGMDEL